MMFSCVRPLASKTARVIAASRAFHCNSLTCAKVTVLGAAGGIGQPLSLLLKLSDEVDELACYDVANAPGVAADLSHIPTKAQITGFLPSAAGTPNEGLAAALKGADVVVIPAGVPRKPGMTRDDLFNTNASIVKSLVEGCAEHCPGAVLAIISNPVNSTIPIAAEVLKSKGVYDPKKLCGVTTLDVIRANTFVAESHGWDPKNVDVTVIGGHAGITILPLFSQISGVKFTPEQLEAITVRTQVSMLHDLLSCLILASYISHSSWISHRKTICFLFDCLIRQFGGDEVVKAKAGTGSATLSMAYAGFLFTENVLKALRGEDNIVQCAFVQSDITEATFFASQCKFGKHGVEKVLPFGTLTEYEKQWFEKLMPDLKSQIQKGIDFVLKK